MWEEAKNRFPVGTRVRGILAQHMPFGIFVDLGDSEIIGLVQIVDFLDEGRMTPERYPPIGASIEAVVLGHTDDRRKQVWLSMKPSKLGDNAEQSAASDRPRD
jgi:ribosomal protein S1